MVSLPKMEEGGIATEEAGEDQRPRLGCEGPSGVRQLREEPDHQTTGQVHHQRAIGKADALRRLLHPTADRVPQHRTNKSANTDKKNIIH